VRRLVSLPQVSPRQVQKKIFQARFLYMSIRHHDLMLPGKAHGLCEQAVTLVRVQPDDSALSLDFNHAGQVP
jgi:hypothetical protein